MNFPMDQAIFRFLFWLVDTPGIGGLLVGLVGGGSLTVYSLVLWWIRRGGEADERETYLFPTPAWHSRHEE